jgi:hypothetical protein
MNISKCLIVAVLTGGLFGNLHASDSPKHTMDSRSKKTYVDSKLVKTTPEGIIVTLGKHAFLVNAIRSDQKGLFFLEKDRLTLIMKSKYWKCPYCPLHFDTKEDMLWHVYDGHTASRR